MMSGWSLGETVSSTMYVGIVGGRLLEIDDLERKVVDGSGTAGNWGRVEEA